MTTKTIDNKPIYLGKNGNYEIKEPHEDFLWPFKYYVVIDNLDGCEPIIKKNILTKF